MAAFDNNDVTLTCPMCRYEFNEKLGILKESPEIPCPGCHKIIKINGGQVKGELARIESALDDLRRTVKGL